MKILICMLGIGGGGAERVLVDFFKLWEEHAKNWQKNSATEGFTEGSRIIDPKQDIDLFLIEKKPQDTYLKWCEEHLHKVFSFPHIFGKIRFLNKFWKRRVLRNPQWINYFIKEQYDVNIGFLEGISTIYISQKHGGKKIGYIHISLSEIRDNTRDEAELKAYLALDSIICVSHYVKDSLLKLYPELAHKHIVVIHNPINTQAITLKAQEHIQQIDQIQRNRFSFLQVGRLTYQKGLATLLEANTILQQEGLKYDLWLVGEGDRYKKELLAYIESSGVTNVKFLGFKENPYAYIKACDVFVLASYYEGYGLVLAESCVLGKAIIASDIPTSKEILIDSKLGECAEFFVSKDARSLADSMRRLYTDTRYKHELESKALAIAKNFDVTKARKAFEEILFQK
ncbi:glycosyltransferase [uncultured Helicobacter sp.]|uniref:glycosyltransferase n=1 Tax=uncultured Helicobacter sp. TaxID=175537 RepID=UPI00374EE446